MKKIPLALSYDDVLLVPQYSTVLSRHTVDLSSQITPRVKLTFPVISINMSDVTGVDMAVNLAKLGGLGFLPRFVSLENQADMVAQVKKARMPAAAAVGIRPDDFLKRSAALVKAGVDILTIDVAHGALQSAIEATKKLKMLYGKKVDIISGVIATYQGAKDLFKAGADSVRVGVGPGTICVTRIVTGVGVPQITATMEAARAAREFGKSILCDGGTKNSGDIVKGLAAGASAVVIGSQLAGCDESPGKLVTIKGSRYKTYNASTSLKEKQKHVKLKIHSNGNYLAHIEGVESLVPYKGPVSGIVTKMQANLKAGFSYCGAHNLKELWHKAEFVRVTQMGARESNAHDVVVKSTI